MSEDFWPIDKQNMDPNTTLKPDEGHSPGACLTSMVWAIIGSAAVFILCLVILFIICRLSVRFGTPKIPKDWNRPRMGVPRPPRMPQWRRRPKPAHVEDGKNGDEAEGEDGAHDTSSKELLEKVVET